MQLSRNELEIMAETVWQDYNSGNKDILNDFYPRILPFCLRVSSKTCGRYIEEFDEEASIARMAILEAFENYNPQRGNFMYYLARVVHSRIIDYQRREKKRPVPLSFLKHKVATDISSGENEIEEILNELSRAEEIKRFSAVLGEFQITLKDLAELAPKQQRARDKALAIAWLVAKDTEMCTLLLQKKTLPLKEWFFVKWCW